MYYAQPKHCRAVRLFSGYVFFLAEELFTSSTIHRAVYFSSDAAVVDECIMMSTEEKQLSKEQVVALGRNSVLTLPPSVYNELQDSST